MNAMEMNLKLLIRQPSLVIVRSNRDSFLLSKCYILLDNKNLPLKII
ncbi:hypothetical protein [Niallia circulans]|nr:hypothetical protein [Niallia circulans]